MSDVLSQFVGQQYINLETFKKSGVGVLTPVWFVEDGNMLYTTTPVNTGKIKRIRNNPQVRVAICDSRGTLKGLPLPAHASLVEGPQVERVEQLLKRKYGFMKMMLGVFGWLRRWQYSTIAIKLES